jgi:beta-glucanase (GH16 family)
MNRFEIADHEPSLLPDGEWTLAWSDEFDGDRLDDTKWSFRRHLFHKEHRAWVGEEGIELDGNSNIIFKMIEKDGNYYSSQLQTGENWYDRPGTRVTWDIAPFSKPKFLHKYGYYEVRCQLQQGDKWWSAFWLQSPNIGTHPDPTVSGVEVDIMESFFPNTYIPHFLHWGGYAEDHKSDTTMSEKRSARREDAIPLEKGFHRFGVLWEEDGYTFFVDGEQSGPKLTSVSSGIEQFILIGTECLGYRDHIPGFHRGREYEALPGDVFVVDYVRVFDKK